MVNFRGGDRQRTGTANFCGGAVTRPAARRASPKTQARTDQACEVPNIRREAVPAPSDTVNFPLLPGQGSGACVSITKTAGGQAASGQAKQGQRSACCCCSED